MRNAFKDALRKEKNYKKFLSFLEVGKVYSIEEVRKIRCFDISINYVVDLAKIGIERGEIELFKARRGSNFLKYWIKRVK